MFAHWDYAYFVGAAYGVSAVALVLLVLWIALDHMARRREIARLEAEGVRRRSDRTGLPPR